MSYNQPWMLEELVRDLSLFWQPLKHLTHEIKEELLVSPFEGKDRVRQVAVAGNEVLIEELT